MLSMEETYTSLQVTEAEALAEVWVAYIDAFNQCAQSTRDGFDLNKYLSRSRKRRWGAKVIDVLRENIPESIIGYIDGLGARGLSEFYTALEHVLRHGRWLTLTDANSLENYVRSLGGIWQICHLSKIATEKARPREYRYVLDIGNIRNHSIRAQVVEWIQGQMNMEPRPWRFSAKMDGNGAEFYLSRDEDAVAIGMLFYPIAPQKI